MWVKPIQKTMALATLVACTWVTWDNWGRFALTDAGVAQAQAHKAEPASAPSLARGKYLATIGGCVSCHTVPGQAVMAGGRAIATPYGDVFSSNLSSSTQHGIGAWTLRDFEMALRWGRSKDGRLLLPVFPYNHTSLLKPEDVQDIYAWLQSLPAVALPTPAHQLTWPLGTQPVTAVWRSLFFKPQTWHADAVQSEAFNRGSYLVQGLGHCAACHGARNAAGSFPAVDDLSGGVLQPQAWVAPSLSQPAQTAMARSSVHELATLLRAGQNPHATVSGPMGEFVQQTSQYLTPEDALAMAMYLKQQAKPSSEGGRQVQVNSARVTQGQAPQLYQTHCADCHGERGQGRDHKSPALAGNAAVGLAQPENLIQMVLYGGYGPSTALRPRPYGMPPFVLTLSNQEIADVITYVRQSWGNAASEVSPMQVDKVRAAKF